ncbi:MAG: hypothetical protein M1588_00540 [Planctomycetes bacterium]|jgi:vacuolar-type H+-ATPase subunit I/STV1|nr:hypothetical protein [Planctomycetota bacterium]
MRAGFVEEIALSGVILLCAGISPNIFVAAQAGYANMQTLALWLLLPSIGVLVATLGFAIWRGYRRLVDRVVVGIAAGLSATIGLEAVRITSFRVFNGMPGDLPQLLGVLLLNRFMEGPTIWSTTLGYAYHFWNGACFGIIFAVILGRRRWFWGTIYGLLVGTGFLLSPATTALGVGFFASQIPAMQVTVGLAHLIFGTILGLLCRRWIHDPGWLFSQEPDHDPSTARRATSSSRPMV